MHNVLDIEASDLLPNRAAFLLADHVRAGSPAMLWGPPGIGKSDIAAQVAAVLGLELIDVRLPLMESVDLRGLPYVKDGVTHFAAPAEFRRTHDKPCMILWDEINGAPMSVQVASYQAILNNRIGEFEFGKGTVHVCAGNDLGDAAGAQRMSSALKNRMAHIDVAADVDGWLSWAGRNGISPLTMGFIKYRGHDALHKHSKDAKAYPTPRSWAMADRYHAHESRRRYDLMSGVVGETVAADYRGFADLVAELDSPAYILANPETARIPAPEKVAALYGVAVALAYAVTESTVHDAVTYIRRIPREYGALYAAMLLQRDKRLAGKSFAKVASLSGEMA